MRKRRITMKKFITVFGLLAVSALALTGCGKSKETLKIYNAGNILIPA